MPTQQHTVSSGPRPSFAARYAWIAVAIVVGLLWTAFTAVWFVVPRLDEIFTEFGVTLPAVSHAVISFSRWLWGQHAGQQIPGIAFAAIPWIALLAIPIYLGSVRRLRPIAIAWLVTLAIGCLLATAVIVISLTVPMRSLIEAL